MKMKSENQFITKLFNLECSKKFNPYCKKVQDRVSSGSIVFNIPKNGSQTNELLCI